jgi:glyoxylase-like metal-dependent hydrolase (beta-lactamase superfamily II)
MKPIKISERNIMFTEPMGKDYNLNIGLIIGKHHNFVIDTGLGSGSIAPILKQLENSRKPIIVINTHAHWDHVWGNWIFHNSMIISHVKCKELMDKYWDMAYNDFSEKKDGEVIKWLPNLIFEQSLAFSEENIEIFHTPGHSIDSISIYDRDDKVLYAGDNIGDTDKFIVPYIDTDIDTFKKLIETYKKYDFNLCISGHNTPQKKDVILLMENALEESWKNQIEGKQNSA